MYTGTLSILSEDRKDLKQDLHDDVEQFSKMFYEVKDKLRKLSEFKKSILVKYDALEELENVIKEVSDTVPNLARLAKIDMVDSKEAYVKPLEEFLKAYSTEELNGREKVEESDDDDDLF